MHTVPLAVALLVPHAVNHHDRRAAPTDFMGESMTVAVIGHPEKLEIPWR